MERWAAAKLTVLALASGLTWSYGHVIAPSPTPAPLGHYSDAVLLFDHPASWKVSHHEVGSSFYNSIVYLSTQPTHDPCVRSVTSTTHSITCGSPIDSLKPGGVLVEWGSWGFPGWDLDHATGSPLQVDGLPAKWDARRPPEVNPRLPRSQQAPCTRMGGDESVTVLVARPVPYNAYRLEACLRSAELDLVESELRGLLDSTRFKQLH
jgi:hypothetical protein